ncbi:MAG: hypothetical protein AABX37_05065 [Nanoarchaeota archaeon]
MTDSKPRVLVVTDQNDPFDRTLDIWLLNPSRQDGLPFTVEVFEARHPPRRVMETELCDHLMDHQYAFVAAPYHLRLDETINAQHVGKTVYYGPNYDEGIDTTRLFVMYRTIIGGFFEEIKERYFS